MSVRVHQLAKELNLNSKDLIARLHELKIKVKGHMSVLDEDALKIIKQKLKGKKKKETSKLKKQDKPKAKPKTKKTTTLKKKTTPKKKTAKKVVTKKTAVKEPVLERKVEEHIEEAVDKKIVEQPVEVATEVIPAKTLTGVMVSFPITVKDLGAKLQVKPNDLIKKLMGKNIFATINQALTEEVANEIASEFDYQLQKAPSLEEKLLEEHKKQASADLVPRPPVITLMGHVDHGKTSLLDVIQESNITKREAGGITQHIGAYRVELKKGKITFLDTPGHEAFTAMRARGANATDIVILVVAADDGIMPQTQEAIDHARAAGVPIVVAINKIDKQNADIDKVKKQLAAIDLQPEDWGGKTITVGVSAKTKEGIDHLLEMVLLEAEMLELKANSSKSADGVVIEGRLSRGKGPVATILVQNGTLREQDLIVIGKHYGKVRAMVDDRGKKLKEVPPSVPVEILGLSGVPEAGECFFAVPDEKTAKEISSQKLNELRQKDVTFAKRITLEDLYNQIKEGKVKGLKIILKADVQGSCEALRDNTLKLSTDEVKLDFIHTGVGLINDADIILAAASNAIVIGFNVGMTPEAQTRAKQERVDTRFYRVIYDAISDVKSAMEGLLEPKVEEVTTGKAKVLRAFRVSKVGLVAGCMISKGKINRASMGRVLRDGEEIHKGRITSLKRFKDDVKEVQEGFECGIGFQGFNDIKPGDIIEAFEIQKTARTL